MDKTKDKKGAAPILRRMPVHTVPVKLEGEYEGWEAEMRTNIPAELFDRFGDGNLLASDKRVALADLITRWNFVDEEGVALPAAKDGGIHHCPLDLLTHLVRRYKDALDEVAALPNP